MAGTRIAGLGHHAPARVVTNSEIEARFGLSEGWIFAHTGIRERRWATSDDAVSDLALPAAEMALRSSALPRAAIGLTLLATSTPDHLLPPTAPLVAHRLNLSASGAVDVTGACAGFLYAFVLADSFVRATGRAALVLGANILSRRVNPDDRVTAPLFSDAAGAVVLAPSEHRDAGLIGSSLMSDGAGYDLIQIPASGSRQTIGTDALLHDGNIVVRDGSRVFAQAVAMMVSSCRTALDAAGIAAADVAHFVPHQANARIIEAVTKKLAIKPALVLSTIAEFGNSSAATIPFSLSWARAERVYRKGEILLVAAAGAGLTGARLSTDFRHSRL
jgi:3-oxoacyl-[acyl-carrier-protein] synthase III